MFRINFAAALLCAPSLAYAKPFSSHAGNGLHPRCNIDWPCASTEVFPDAGKNSKQVLKRDRFRAVELGGPMVPPETQRSFLNGITRPARYVAGRLVCAINVNAALAERGIRGTGSALAKSFLHWGRSTAPTPGAVAVYNRKGGGHVAIVSRVEGGRVYVWNPSSRGKGWREVEYRRRAIDYRAAL